MALAGHVSRAMMERYSHIRMEAKRRAVDTGRPFAAYWRDRGGQTLPLPAIPAGQTQVRWFKDGEIELVRPIIFKGRPLEPLHGLT